MERRSTSRCCLSPSISSASPSRAGRTRAATWPEQGDHRQERGAHPGGPFYPFANEPNGGWNLIYGAGPASTVWALGNTNEEFLDIDPDKRDDTSGVPSQNLFNNIFVNDVSGRVKQPPWPGQLSFYLNTYDTQVQVTSHGGTDFCLLDRKPPPD